jgi:hypothetical protein
MLLSVRDDTTSILDFMVDAGFIEWLLSTIGNHSFLNLDPYRNILLHELRSRRESPYRTKNVLKIFLFLAAELLSLIARNSIRGRPIGKTIKSVNYRFYLIFIP